MTATECADILRATIRNRERLHEKEIDLIGAAGTVEAHGHISPESDILYQAMRFALSCVEEKIQK